MKFNDFLSYLECREYAEYPNEPQSEDLSLSMETGRAACRNITQSHSDIFDRHEVKPKNYLIHFFAVLIICFFVCGL